MGKKVDAYRKYEARLKLTGYNEKQSWVECLVDEATDDVALLKVNCASQIVRIPDFVNRIVQATSAFWNIADSELEYKIIYNGNWDCNSALSIMFWGSQFSRLDLTEFKFRGIKEVVGMFINCRNLEKITFGEEVLAVQDAQHMFKGCSALEEIDMSGLKMPHLQYADYMFYESGIKRADLSGIESKNLKGMHSMFKGCEALKQLKIQTKNLGCCSQDADTRDMFQGCKGLTGKSIQTRDKNIREAFYLHNKQIQIQ